MRIFIADVDGGYRPQSRLPDAFVEDLIDRTGAREMVRVQWPEPGTSAHGRRHTWESAAAAGAADLGRLVRLHPSDDIVLIGGGCGSRVIHSWMDAHPDMLDRIAAVGLIGDPFRPRGRTIPGLPDPGGQGVSGIWEGPIPERTFWLSAPGDPLSGVDRDSLLRAAVRESDLSPVRVYDDVLADLPGNRAMLAARLGVAHHPGQWSPKLLRRVDRAREVLHRHEIRGHIELYESGGNGGVSLLERLARVIADRIVKPGGLAA